jgi:hypothetical protein
MKEGCPVAVLSNRGAAFLGLDRVFEAEDAFRGALLLDPTHAESYGAFGDELHSMTTATAWLQLLA